MSLFEKHPACDMSRNSEGSMWRLSSVSIERAVKSHLLFVHYTDTRFWSYIRGCYGEISDLVGIQTTSCFIRQRTGVQWQIRECPSELNPNLRCELSKRVTVFLSSLSFAFLLYFPSVSYTYLILPLRPFISLGLFSLSFLPSAFPISLLLFRYYFSLTHLLYLCIYLFNWLRSYPIIFALLLYSTIFSAFIPSVFQ